MTKKHSNNFHNSSSHKKLSSTFQSKHHSSTISKKGPIRKRTVTPQKQMFAETIRQMKTMVQGHYGSYTKDTLGLQKKNTKVPFTHLMGRRNKIVERHSEQKNRSREEDIQYDSSMRLLNSHIVEEAGKKERKDGLEKNMYKFAGASEGKLGRQTEGMLRLSKRDLKRINGKQFGSSLSSKFYGQRNRSHKRESKQKIKK